MALVTTTVDAAVGTVALAHPARRNALSRDMVEAIVGALADFGRQRLRAVILRAAPGSKVWSAGHDVHELPESGRDPLGWDDPLRHLIREIEFFPAPVIAMVEGGVWGGACETVFACDIVVATPSASFGGAGHVIEELIQTGQSRFASGEGFPHVFIEPRVTL